MDTLHISEQGPGEAWGLCISREGICDRTQLPGMRYPTAIATWLVVVTDDDVRPLCERHKLEIVGS